jgi:hypothetical protein
LSQRKDDGGRGDLTDEQWLKLKPLLPPQKAHTGQQPTTTAAFSMVFFGYIELVRLGEIFQSTMVSTAQSQVGFIDGELKGCGNGCGKISCNKLMLLER